MKRAYWISPGTAAGILLVAFGCGGVGGADGLFNGGNGGAASSGSGQMSASSTAGSTSGSGDTASTSSGGGMSASSSSSGDMSSSSVGPASSSSSGGGPTTILCGAAMCPVGNMNACCWDIVAKTAMCVQGPPQSDGCNTDQMMGGHQTRIECQDAADCNGQMCCGHLIQTMFGNYYDLVSCQPTCGQNVTLCDPNGPNICPMGQTCGQSSLLQQGYFRCN